MLALLECGLRLERERSIKKHVCVSILEVCTAVRLGGLDQPNDQKENSVFCVKAGSKIHKKIVDWELYVHGVNFISGFYKSWAWRTYGKFVRYQQSRRHMERCEAEALTHGWRIGSLEHYIVSNSVKLAFRVLKLKHRDLTEQIYTQISDTK